MDQRSKEWMLYTAQKLRACRSEIARKLYSEGCPIGLIASYLDTSTYEIKGYLKEDAENDGHVRTHGTVGESGKGMA